MSVLGTFRDACAANESVIRGKTLSEANSDDKARGARVFKSMLLALYKKKMSKNERKIITYDLTDD